MRLLMERLLNLLMLAEGQAYLQAEPYQRTPEHRDQANGFKPKTLKTRLGGPGLAGTPGTQGC
ncbi:MAG TPA: hypothetical protein EYH28_00030, partial [Anaerolineaceae bacterium]|nr:hypothetical protein [Anaerolineaceae bacterium]